MCPEKSRSHPCVALLRKARDDIFFAWREIGKTTSNVVFTDCYVLVERLVKRGRLASKPI